MVIKRIAVFIATLLLLNYCSAEGQISHYDPPECPPEGTVFFPNPDSCTKYYVCTQGQLVEFECPPGTYWNQAITSCDLPENVECTIELTTTTTETITTEVIPTGPPEPNCPATPGVYKLPYPGNCTLYFICYNNGDEYEVKACAEGLLFDTTISACNIAELVDCYDGSYTTPIPITDKPTAPPGDYNCPTGVEFIYMPHPDVCTLFYWCRNGEYDGQSNCGQGLWFSFAWQACVSPYDSECDKEQRPPTTPSGEEIIISTFDSL